MTPNWQTNALKAPSSNGNAVASAGWNSTLSSALNFCRAPRGQRGGEDEARRIEEFSRSMKGRSLGDISNAITKFGSCYSYVPAPVTRGKRSAPAPGESGNPQLLGQCNQ